MYFYRLAGTGDYRAQTTEPAPSRQLRGGVRDVVEIPGKLSVDQMMTIREALEAAHEVGRKRGASEQSRKIRNVLGLT